MREVTIKLYQYSELPESIQVKVLSSLHDINTDYCWYEHTYDDAEEIGLRITGFNLDYVNQIEGYFKAGSLSGYDVAQAIIASHGEQCDTYVWAKSYLAQYSVIDQKHDVTDNDDEYTEERMTLDDEMLPSLLECYWRMLRDDYTYRQSKQAIVETIECNEYEFYCTGELSDKRIIEG